MIKVFYLELVKNPEFERVWLRRYRPIYKDDVTMELNERCPVGAWGSCDKMHLLGDYIEDAKPEIPHDDALWPTKCDCGYFFKDTDNWQRFSQSLFRRTDTGEVTTLREAPVGAMWDANWMLIYRDPEKCGNEYRGPDGRCLVVKTPGGDWMIDSRASNCGRPDDNIHKCWVRHGDPTTGDIHVDKNGDTCSAGAGSILCGNYHGFLHNGHLVQC